MKLVVVESPAKAKTINKYLGPDYKVLASFGHIRDLPSKDGSVDPNKDFLMTWELSASGKKRLNDIITALKDADTLVLASDPDREGEAIAWHILEELTARKKIAGKKSNGRKKGPVLWGGKGHHALAARPGRPCHILRGRETAPRPRAHCPKRAAISSMRAIWRTWKGQRLSQWPQAVQSEAWRASLA